MNQLQSRPKPLVLLVLDGLGVAPKSPGNAVTSAKTPNLNNFWNANPHCFLNASGSSVGLPSGVNGNSEVGHLSIGAGKVVFQEIARIDHEIENKKFFQNTTFLEAVSFVKNNNGDFHLMGLVSPGKVHSSMDHLYASLEFCKQQGLDPNKVFIHVFTDGRDTPPQSAKQHLEQLDTFCKQQQIGRIASIIGRYLAMDRDENWNRTQKAYELLTQGKGTHVSTWQEAIDTSYSKGQTDEFIEPFVIAQNDQPLATVKSGDSLVFFNYRPDRAVQISKAFEDDDFSYWQRQKIQNLFFAGFSNYEKGIPLNRAKEDTALPGGERAMVEDLFAKEMEKTKQGFPERQVFPPQKVPYCLCRVLSDAGLKQLKITESEKFPHVTYFFNCREKEAFPGEERIEIASPKEVPTYDQKPDMSAVEVTNTMIEKIKTKQYDFVLANFAPPDMVGHTGNLAATVRAIEVIDQALGRIVNATFSVGGTVVVTADHGNAEELINLQTGKKDTEHSTNPVPFVYIARNQQAKELPTGLLADIAPTVLAILGIEKPKTMVGRNLLS